MEDDFATEYARLAHAVQTGVAYDQDPTGQSPKHLRVGVNLRAVEHGALVKLLIDKGIIGKEEYEKALLNEMRVEVRRYEDYLSEQYGGAGVTLA